MQIGDIPTDTHAQDVHSVFKLLETQQDGLTPKEVAKRLATFGENTLPQHKPTTLLQTVIRQFLNPLIYILLAAALISFALGSHEDAIFIGIILLVNAIIGTMQETSAERSASALQNMVTSKSMVMRHGHLQEVSTQELVPGDIVSLDSGRKVPADLRLFQTNGLEIDEALLTGESLPVLKLHTESYKADTTLADRLNMAYTGTLVTKGRGAGVVVATGSQSAMGQIARSLTEGTSAKPPLIVRMEVFTRNIAVFLLIVTLCIAGTLLLQGMGWHEVLMFSVALAVAAIPEGLPVSLTVALAIATRKMSKRHVIVRKLPTVEALGSCTFIATDKTGTLTVNQMTVTKIVSAFSEHFEIPPESTPETFDKTWPKDSATGQLLDQIILTTNLCNEAELHSDGTTVGDAVDAAFLTLAQKRKIFDARDVYELIDEIPFEPENQYAATLHRHSQTGSSNLISVKGSVEKLLKMSSRTLASKGNDSLDSQKILHETDRLAEAGFRVLAVACGKTTKGTLADSLHDLCFLGLTCMIDPLRPEAHEAIISCKNAGIDIAMLTGDHPKTAGAIAKELGLATEHVVTGPMLKAAGEGDEFGKLVETSRVFARVEPQQKLSIVQYFLKTGRFVAVTGDGANDAPSLKAANVGVAMGKSGTDIAKETADLIITDDRFASIVAGVEEGRIAYANIRKVVFLLLSTGAAEILIFLLSLAFGTPLPLTPIQLLWLNLVTNGIQDKGLAFEPGEGDELHKPPRKPNEPLFDRLMLERITLSATVMGSISFAFFYYLNKTGMDLVESRNLTLLLMVLFENVMIGNCRSETRSAFTMNPFSNSFLLIGTLLAQLIHIGAMYTPWLNEALGIHPVSVDIWIKLFILSLSVFIAMEIYKFARVRKL